MNIATTIIRKSTHNFIINITDKGRVTYSIDGGIVKHAKYIKDGKLYFIGTQEIIVKGELQEWKSIEIPEKALIVLVEAQNRIKAALEEEQTIIRLKQEGKRNILKRVDKWKKRIRYYRKERKGEKIFYAIHDFTIGAQTYRFYERKMNVPMAWDNIIINPVYKVDRDLPGIGAIPVQKGELTFWFFFTEEKQWHSIRELTLNEMICIEIIHSYGMVKEGKI